jgi:hypothetical protein
MIGGLAFGTAAFGSFTTGAVPPLPIGARLDILVNGEPARVRFPSLTIHDVLGSQPNTADLTFLADVTVGSAVQARRADAFLSTLLFSGVVQASTRGYESTPAIIIWPAALIDHTFLANRRRPFGSFVTTSITTIAQQIIATYAPELTATYVQAGLPATSINFDGTDPFTTCLQNLANGCGARVKIDYLRNVHLYIPPETGVPSPDPIDAAHPPLNSPPIHFETDLSQVRTRVYGKGHGESVPTDVLANETILPIADAVMFSPTGSKAITALTPDGAQTQRIAYTGVQLGGAGSIVGPGFRPVVAPIAQPTTGAGLPAGTYSYAYTDVTATGESIPSPIAAAVTGPMAAPSTALTGAAEGGTGVEPGTYQYAVTFTGGGGETMIGPASAGVTSHDVATPGPSSITENTGSGISQLWSVGNVVKVAVTFRTATGGETLGSPYSNAYTATVAPGSTWPHAMDLHNLPVPTDPAVTGKRLYLHRVSGQPNDGVVLYLDLAPALSSYTWGGADYTDVTNMLPASNTALARLLRLTNIPIGPSGTTARKIYRWTTSDPIWKLQQTLTGNAANATTDQTTQGSLGPAAPTSNTTAFNQVTLSGIATGPTGTTARKVYRTAVNAAALQLLPTGSTFANNTATGPYVDVNADASLGATAPTSDTSGLTPAAGYVLPGSTTILTVSAAVFLAGGGWARHGQQVVRYTGVAADGLTLTGVPATGPGAITTAMTYGSAIEPAPALVGVSGLTAAIAKGSAVHIWVQRDDTAAQAALGQLERNPDGTPTDGIREFLISDERRGEPSLIEVCDADLAKFARPEVKVTYATFDQKTKAGLTVHIALEAPAGGPSWGPVGDYVIQDVTITIDPTPAMTPRYTVRASSSKFTFLDLLQRVLMTTH